MGPIDQTASVRVWGNGTTVYIQYAQSLFFLCFAIVSVSPSVLTNNLADIKTLYYIHYWQWDMVSEHYVFLWIL